MRLTAITDEISQDLGRALDVLQEYGCQEAELRNVYDTYIVDADEALLARVEGELARTGMRVVCVDTPFFKCDLDETLPATGATHGATPRSLAEQMALLDRSIALAHRFGTPLIRIFSFWRRGPLTPQIEDRIVDALIEPCRIAEAAGVTLLMENEHACYLGSGVETARAVARVGSPALKMVWDPGNAFFCDETPFPDGWLAAAPHTAHVHIKDAALGEDGNRAWTLVGAGQIDYAGQLAALHRAGYTGALSLETHFVGPDGSAENASRRCLDALMRLLADVR